MNIFINEGNLSQRYSVDIIFFYYPCSVGKKKKEKLKPNELCKYFLNFVKIVIIKSQRGQKKEKKMEIIMGIGNKL